jgi:hypothetical protein
VIDRLPGEEQVYLSVDTVESDTFGDQLRFPPEFLNEIEGSGLPRHRLPLKVNAVVLLMRNFHTARGLINGTRLRVTQLMSHCIQAEVLSASL